MYYGGQGSISDVSVVLVQVSFRVKIALGDPTKYYRQYGSHCLVLSPLMFYGGQGLISDASFLLVQVSLRVKISLRSYHILLTIWIPLSCLTSFDVLWRARINF